MPAHSRRIIHQHAQASSFETFYSKPESLTIVLLSKYIEQQPSYPWYSPSCCWKMFSLSDLVTAKLPRAALSQVAHRIPVLPSRYIGKCADRALKRSDIHPYNDRYIQHNCHNSLDNKQKYIFFKAS